MIDLEAARRILDAWGHANPRIRVLLIYGSYAKGTATPTSDLDIAVVIAPADEEDAFTTWTAEADKWAEEIRALLGFRDVDLQWWDVDGGTTPIIAAGVTEAKIPVHEKVMEECWPNLISIDAATFDELVKGRKPGSEERMPPEQYGNFYWCVGLKTTVPGKKAKAEVYAYADRVEVTPVGALVLWRMTRLGDDQKREALPTPEVNMAFAPGQWEFVHAASLMDGSAVAASSWPGQAE